MIEHLHKMLRDPAKHHIRDIIERRIYAHEQEIAFTNPFGEVDETLYRCWRSGETVEQEAVRRRAYDME